MGGTLNDVSFHNLFYLASLGIVLAIIFIVMLAFFLYGFIKYWKKGVSKKDGAKHGLYLAWKVFWMGTSILVLVASGFAKIHWALGWVLMVIILQSGFMNIMKVSPEYKYDKFKGKINNYIRSLFEGLKVFGIRNSLLVLLAFIIVSFISSFFFYDVCIGIHPFRVSTKYSRRIQGYSCKPGEICNFILTVPEDLSNSIISNWHSFDEPEYSFTLYGTDSHENYSGTDILADNPYGNIANATYFKMDSFANEESRWVSWADITMLTPSTTYFLVVGIKLSNGQVLTYPERKFKTAPNDGTPYNFITGGDMGLGEDGESLSISAAETEPLFLMLGGDVAYDSGFTACYKCWDEWFNRWDTTFLTPLGYSIPIITTIGNHEAAGWKSSRGSAKFYIRYLPFELGLQGIDPNDRPLQHSHVIGNNTIIVVLDSWVIDTIDSQVSYLEQVLEDNKDKTFKFALYHIALYPCTSISMDTEISDTASEYWEPVFSKYGLTIGYENHYHLYKRSKQLTNGKEHVNGTLYIGDGAFGVLTTIKPIAYSYLEEYGSIMHIIHTKVGLNNVSTETINVDNEVFDRWNRTFK